MTKRWSAVTRAMWTDARFLGLSSPEPNAQTLWLYLLTNPHQISIPGLLPLGVGAIADGLGWPASAVRTLLEELVEVEMIEICERPALIFLPRAITHNQPANPNMIKGWRNGFDNLPETGLRDRAILQIRDHLRGSLKPVFDKVFTGALSRAKSATSKAQTTPKTKPRNGFTNGMGNKDQDKEVYIVEGSSGSKPKKRGPKKTVISEDARKLASYLREAIDTHSPDYAANVKSHRLESWAMAIDRLLRLDKADPEEVRAVIRWAHIEDKNGFWRPNLLGATALRKQFPRLRLQAQQEGALRKVGDENSWKTEHGAWAIRVGQRTAVTGGSFSGATLIAAARLEGVPVPEMKTADRIAAWAASRG